MLWHKNILIHATFILTFLASMSINSSNVAITILRAISGLTISFLFVGQSLKSLLKKYLPFFVKTLADELASSLLLSLLYFTIVSTILCFQYSLNAINLTLILMLPIFVSYAIRLRSANFQEPETQMSYISNKGFFSIASILVFSFSVALVFRSGFSWPSMPGWDIYTYLAGSNWIITHHGTTNITPVAQNSLFPSSYLFQILVASIATIIGTDPYSIFWFAPFVIIPIYGLLIYGISHQIIKRSFQSLSAALIGVTICGGESLLGPHYFVPSTLFTIIFMLLLIAILDLPDEGPIPIAFIFCSFILCYSFYYWPLPITLPVLILLFVAKMPTRSWFHQHLIPIFLISLMILIPMSWWGASLLDSNTYPLNAKLDLLTTSYPDLLWLAFLLGCLIIMAQYLRDSSKWKIPLGLIVYSFALLIVYFLPPTASTRSETVLRPFVAIIAALPFNQMKDAIYAFRRNVSKIGGPNFRSGNVLLLLSSIPLFISIGILIQPYLLYARNVPYWSNISMDEYLAAQWISQNSRSDVYILTDPSTGYVLRGLTIRNSSTSFIIGGWTPSPHERGNLSEAIYSFFNEEDASKIPTYWDRFPMRPSLVVITTRTSGWAGWGGLNSTFCAPSSSELISFPGMDKFSTPLFVELARWETVRIYNLTSAMIISIWSEQSFSDGWSSWYTDGACTNHNSSADGDILRFTVQASNLQNAWTGPTQQLPNCSGATYLKIRYRIDVPSYALEIVLWRSKEPWLIHILKPSKEWHDEAFTLTEDEARSLTKVGLIIWTKDTLKHIIEVDYIVIGGIAVRST